MLLLSSLGRESFAWIDGKRNKRLVGVREFARSRFHVIDQLEGEEMTTTAIRKEPSVYGADPVLGNYTTDAAMHLWCANALAIVVLSPDATFDSWNDDIQDAVRYLLRCEIERAMNAEKAGGIT